MSRAGWTHLVCERCWNLLVPERKVDEPAFATTGDPCCRCGLGTRSGIFYRASPETFGHCAHDKLPEARTAETVDQAADDVASALSRAVNKYPGSGLRITPPARERLARFFQRFAVGDCVRASLTIFDAASGREVAEGATGYVQAVDVGGCAPLVAVAWEGREDEPMTTSVDNLDPVKPAPARREPPLDWEHRCNVLALRALDAYARWLDVLDELEAHRVLVTGEIPLEVLARCHESMCKMAEAEPKAAEQREARRELLAALEQLEGSFGDDWARAHENVTNFLGAVREYLRAEDKAGGS